MKTWPHPLRLRGLFAAMLGLCLAGPSVLVADDMTTNAPQSLWERDTLTGGWGEVRSRWSEKGFDFGLEYTGEFLANVQGGVKRGGLYQQLLKTLLDFDLEKTSGWKGAHIHASSLWLWGTRPDDIAGLTGSERAAELIADWPQARRRFVKVFPHEYRRALKEMAANRLKEAA